MNNEQGNYVPLAPLACATPEGTAIAAAGREMLVVNKLAARLQFFDAATHAQLADIPMARFPHEVILSPDRKSAFVSIYGQGVFGKNSENPGREVAIIDLATRSQTGAIDVSPYRGPHGMAFDARGLLWASCDVSGVIVAIDVTRREVVAALPTGSFGTHWLAITPDGDTLYASNKNFPFAVVIDTVARTLRANIPLPRGSEGLAVSPDGARLYVMAQRPQSFYVIDTTLDAVIATVPLEGFAVTPEGRNPQKRVQISPDGRDLLITSFNTGEIAIASLEEPDRQTVLAVEKGPMGIAFASAGLAYVMNHDQGSVSVVDVPNRRIVGSFITAAGPETMALY